MDRTGIVHAREHRGHHPVQRRAVGDHGGAEVDALAHAHDRHAVFADVAGDDDVVAGACAFGSDVHSVGHQPDAGGVDEEPVRTALSDDLGVPGDDADARLCRGLAHRLGDGAEDLDLQALLDDESRRQSEGLSTAAGEVVDGAVDGEVADVAAGEEQRVDHVGVGGQRDPPAVGLQHRRIPRRAAGRAEGRQEEVLDQFFGEDASPAVAHDDALGLAQRHRADPVRRVREVRHSQAPLSASWRLQTIPAAGTGSRPRTRPRWTPWWRRVGSAACRRCRMPGTGSV